MLCERDTFLNELHKLFERKKKGGTVWVTMKRTNMKPRKSSKQHTSEYRCLIRATDGKAKITTCVSGADFLKFQAAYGLILRAHIDGLKRREKSKAKK